MQRPSTTTYHSTRASSPYERINEEIETQYLVDEIDEHLQSLDIASRKDKNLRGRHRSTSRERKKRSDYAKSPIDKTRSYNERIYSPENDQFRPELRVEDLQGFPLRPNHLQVRVSQFDDISPISPTKERNVHLNADVINDELEYFNTSTMLGDDTKPPSPTLSDSEYSDFQVECSRLQKRIEKLLNAPDKITYLTQKKPLKT
jgi:hypothetical protein